MKFSFSIKLFFFLFFVVGLVFCLFHVQKQKEGIDDDDDTNKTGKKVTKYL